MRKIFIILITVILLITSGCSTQPRSENDVSQKPKAEESNNLEDNSNIMLYDYEESYNMSSTESIWKNELDFAVDKFNNILTPTDKEDFFQIQKAWESSTLDQINFERDYISNQEEYNINLGTSFQYLNLSEIRESYRERTFQIKYLLYLYEQSNTKISESDYQSLVFSSD